MSTRVDVYLFISFYFILTKRQHPLPLIDVQSGQMCPLSTHQLVNLLPTPFIRAWFFLLLKRKKCIIERLTVLGE